MWQFIIWQSNAFHVWRLEKCLYSVIIPTTNNPLITWHKTVLRLMVDIQWLKNSWDRRTCVWMYKTRESCTQQHARDPVRKWVQASSLWSSALRRWADVPLKLIRGIHKAITLELLFPQPGTSFTRICLWQHQGQGSLHNWVWEECGKQFQQVIRQ